MLELDYVVQSLTNAQKSSALVRVPSDSCTAGQSGRVQSQVCPHVALVGQYHTLHRGVSAYYMHGTC